MILSTGGFQKALPRPNKATNETENNRATRLGSHSCLKHLMLQSLLSLVFAAVMWVQVPQWQPDWSECSIDTPDVDCHWYVTAPDNTFGEGFNWENAPWFSAEGLQDVAELRHTMTTIHSKASTES